MAAGTEVYEVPRGRTPGEPFRPLAERFRGVTDVREATRAESDTDPSGERSGTYPVRFEGTVYLVDRRLFPPER